MANYNNLKAGIDAVIKTNGRQEISGAALNAQLKNMITELGAGYQYMGVATPATNPGTPDANVFYLASEAGTYTNFGGIVINEGEVCALVWNGSWTKEVTGAATADQLNQLVIYDVSANNDGATFASLSALLSSENLSTLIPIAVRCGGMSIRFVQSSDNKYVQYRLMSDTFNTTPANWQGVDDEPTVGSDNLVKSGGVAFGLNAIIKELCGDALYQGEDTGYNSPHYITWILRGHTYLLSLKVTNSGSENNDIGFWGLNNSELFWISNSQTDVIYKVVTPTANTSISIRTYDSTVEWAFYEAYSLLDGLKNIDSTPIALSNNCVKSSGVCNSISDVAKHLSDTIVSGTLTNKNTPFKVAELKVGKKYILSLKVTSAGDNTNEDTGWWYEANGSTSCILGAVPQKFLDEQFFIYAPTNDGDLCVRTYSSTIQYAVYEYCSKENYLDFISQLLKTGNNLYNKTLTHTASNYPIYLMNLSGEGVYYLYIKVNDSPTDTSLDYGFYKDVNGVTTNILKLTKDEIKKGFGKFVYIEQDCELYYRTYDSTSCDIRVVRLSLSERFIGNNWKNKVISFYGDSISGNDGKDLYPPFINYSPQKWPIWVGDFFKLSAIFMRGVGGQSIMWASGGGTVNWVSPTGAPINRLDGVSYDDWDGTTFPSGVTQEMINNGEAFTERGSFCSWLRIKCMYPESIKDSIAAVVVMGGTNDTYNDTEFEFIENDTTDAEWAQSSQYSEYGGDYNIATSFKGAIASTIMKLQAWLPNAVIILATPLSGFGQTGEKNLALTTPEYNKAKLVKEMANVLSLPLIDIYATCGINGFNRETYIVDTVHPFNNAGRKKLGFAMISGLSDIII